MTKRGSILNLKNHYKPSVLLMSLLTGLIFFLMPGSLIIILFANIVVLYVPYLLYLLLALYVMLILISLFSNKVLIETLFNYQDKSLEINYKSIYNKLVMISFSFITIAIIIGYLIYLSFN
jgi:hypothetical protein